MTKLIGVYSIYRLFSHTKITGSFHTAARLSASWNAPMFVVPSPKKQTETSLSHLYWARQAAPQHAAGQGQQRGRLRPVPAQKRFEPAVPQLRLPPVAVQPFDLVVDVSGFAADNVLFAGRQLEDM